MIPGRIRQIAKTTALAAAVVLLWFLAYDRGAGVAFAVTTCWMLANLLVWTVVMNIVLRPGEQAGRAGILLGAISVKLVLLIGGVIVLKIFSPYTHLQLWAIIAGVSSVLVVAVLKAAGSKLAAVSRATDSAKKDHSAKVL